MRYLVSDIGRTKLRLAVSLDGQTLTESSIQATPSSPEAGLALITDWFKSLPDDSDPIAGFGLGLSRRVWPEWNREDLRLRLETLVGADVCLENDAALAALGEGTAGAARDFNLSAYVTVSTGVGGAKIEFNQLARNAWGFEPGQQSLVVEGEIKTLEELVSGQAVEKRYGRPPREIQDELIWQELSRFLAIGLANSILHWSPECLVLGGSMFKVPGFRLEILKPLIEQQLTIFPERPVIRLAALGEQSALIGALAYLTHRLPSANP